MEPNLENAANGPTETVVGPSVKIQGDVISEGNIRIEGQVTGKVQTTQSVYIGDKAKITADVIAGSAIIAGEILGNIKVGNHLIMQGSAVIAGDISCSILRVEDGARFSGKCTMGDGTKKRQPEEEAE
jgi:cytoskeletal protein CcmA (bactofilin family)